VGRWSFPRSPSTFCRCRLGPRGFPGRAAPPPPKRWDVGPHDLGLSFRALLTRLEPLATSGKPEDSSSSSRGIARLRPSTGRPSRVHSRPLANELPSGHRYHPVTSRSALVVSHHLDGLLRAPAAGLLHPAASHEVRRVSLDRYPSCPKALQPVNLVSRDAVYPSKGSPRQQPYRITAAAALLPLNADLLARTLAPAEASAAGAGAPRCSCARIAVAAEALAATRRLRRDGGELELSDSRSRRSGVPASEEGTSQRALRPRPRRRLTGAPRCRDGSEGPWLPGDDAPSCRSNSSPHRSLESGHRGDRARGARALDQPANRLASTPRHLAAGPKARGGVWRRLRGPAEAGLRGTRWKPRGVGRPPGRTRTTPSRMRSESIGASRGARFRTSWPAPLRRTSRFQGFSPLTSPLRPSTVSSTESLAPPMGLCPLQGLSSLAVDCMSSALPNPSKLGWGAPGRGLRGESRRRFPRTSLRRLPCGGRLQAGSRRLVAALAPRLRLFSAWRGAVSRLDVPTAEAATTIEASPSKSVRVPRS